MNFINQMEPWFDENEANHLHEYMTSGGWVTEFNKTREFERMIAEYTGSEFCSVVANGTVSLSIALMACGVGIGDEVIVPDYTMVASPNSAELIGAKAVFVDIDRKSLCMDLEKMKEAITNKTKAIMLVTINGRCPDNINEFVSFCKERGLWLIEDAAQSLGSRHGGKHLGTFGDIGSFSFSAPKIITTGQGGALVTDNPELFDRIKKIRDFGREKGGVDHYLVKGWNFKFTDIQAIIGIEQMKKLEWRVNRKKEIGKLYESLLSELSEIEFIPTNYDNTTPWFVDILVEDRVGLQGYLKENGIGSREFYPPLHCEPVYGYDGNYPTTVDVSRKGLWLPSSSKLTNDEVFRVCECIKSYYRGE